MKVNPDEKQLLGKTGGYLTSNRSRTLRKEDAFRFRGKIRAFMEGKLVTVIMSLVTVFALFGDDMRLWLTTKPADPFFYSGLIISFVLFTAEILTNSIVVDDFKYSFFFWLDIIATLSLIPDIRWWLDALGQLIGSNPSYYSADAIVGVMSVQSVAQSKIQKVIKSLRLIRLIRIIKLYKYIVQSKKDDEGDNKKKRKKFETEEEESEQSLFKKETDPSKLGKALSDTTTRRVIIGVLLMLMVLPLLSFSEIDYSSDYGLRELFWFGRSNCKSIQGDFFCEDGGWITEEGWHEMLRGYTQSAQSGERDGVSKSVLWLYIPDYTKAGRMNNVTFIPQEGSSSSVNPYWHQEDKCAGFQVSSDCPWRYEEMELSTFTPSECLNSVVPGCDQLVAYARFNKREEKVSEAILQFSTTIFTCIVLTVASLTFNNDTQQIVIKPIKKIVEIIQTLAENPLKKPSPPKKDDESDKGHMKTQMLELTIFKISTLLQRGFGELGANIVAQTFTSTEQYMDLLIPGKKMNVIFSVCRIRQFTETTECLQDEIIVFVNKIVKIIHECAKKWDGAPTKNYGDKYLLTWKLPTLHNPKSSNNLAAFDDGNQSENPSGIKVQDHNDSNHLSVPTKKNYNGIADEDDDIIEAREEDIIDKRTEIADKALISAVKIVVELRRAQDLQAYSRHPKIAPKFGQNYKTKMTFGLHAGWTIEGAIGSEFKIDALYISPDAQIAQRIEEFCAHYDETILMTQDLFSLLSEKGQNTLRRIDNIVLNESKDIPREIYTFDMSFNEETDNLSVYADNNELGGLIKHEQFENHSIEMFKTKGVDYMFTIDHDFYTLQKFKNDTFEQHFRSAYLAYSQGDWISAQNHITQCLELRQEDGPCLALSEYMEKHKNIPPEHWTGFRNIDEKDAAPSMSFIKPDFDDDMMDEDDEEIDENESIS